MTEPAAIKATFADIRSVKGRKSAQLIFEIPVEHATEALRILGGYPQPASEVWCGIARLNVQPAKEEKPKRKFDELPLTQQIGIICNEPRFWKFLQYNDGINIDDAEEAADLVRARCGVQSRSDIEMNAKALNEWRYLAERYEAWKAYVP